MSRGRRERTIEDHFVKRMAECGYVSIKGDAAAEKVAGLPDRIFFGHGPRTIIIEFKRDGARKNRRGEKLQGYVRAQFAMRGYEVHRVEGKAEAEEVFGKITGENLYAEVPSDIQSRREEVRRPRSAKSRDRHRGRRSK